MRRLYALAACLALATCLWLTAASAHDLITADAAQAWLQQIREWKTLRESAREPQRAAEAAYRIGVVRETIRELLNQDLLAHGAVGGLASQYLVAELRARGEALEVSKTGRRYLSSAAHFRDALRLAPDAPFAADAAFRLLDGLYQDYYGDDPLGAGDAPAAAEMIGLADMLEARFPAHARREEIQFIGAILYTRAGRDCAASDASAAFARKARRAIADFERRYPQSLRAAAMPVLRDALGSC